MGLPAELLTYAENLYRRFPEEFMALGMPGLENVFDLRPSGSWSRSIKESPTEKTVEITIRRWNAPQCGPYMQGPMPTPWYPTPHGAMPYGPQQMPWMHMGHCMPTGSTGPGAQPQPAPAPAANVTAPVAASGAAAPGEVERLGRLESALSALKPQIEALIMMQAASAAQPAPAVAPPAGMAQAPPAAGAPTPPPPMADGAPPPAAGGTGTPPLPAPGGALTLKDRRNVANLQIQTVPKAKSAEPPPSAQAGSAQPPQQQPQQPQQPQQQEPPRQSPPQDDRTVLPTRYATTVEGRRPTVNINAVRVAPTALDPASPRSPGRFSVWR
mmetsp:Transcript_70729/g.204923  ORF Transcript_70729/g.204923 Transcript_70729/m.204923 type:complete len:327 (+) Transcript_70729:91-1071(+)